jgi:hypothetical protein
VFSGPENPFWKSDIAWRRSSSILQQAHTKHTREHAIFLCASVLYDLLTCLYYCCALSESGNEINDVFYHQWCARPSTVSKFATATANKFVEPNDCRRKPVVYSLSYENNTV